ncbi:alanine dehydrogenase [Estrella lausannensis]|uniref:Alanine dehydrogenase n=1 Tax=Estrella lausannensis TaxID=483423 RepID=A0A0H5DS90_9BACT|nr:alanine dehydrogenase [Estrella lausannensis]CRX39163.1 Alanine dehydrogenase [Estrella lausannensis]
MLIGIPKEIKKHEYRVGATPAIVKELTAHGHSVIVEQGAGEKIGFTDAKFEEAGALIGRQADEAYRADLVVKVKEPQPEEFNYLRKGQTLFCYLHLAAEPVLTRELLEKNVTAIAYETVTDREGKLPLLTPMSAIAGRFSIQAGAACLQLNNGGKGMLLSGIAGVRPARVLVIGGGVSGTEALRAALGLGADVTVLDTKIERLRELDLLFGPKLRTRLSTQAVLEELLPEADLVIGAVLAKLGKRAPRLISRQMLKTMEPGSAVVDISIDQGGVFETSRPTTHENPTYIEEGIVHYCVTNMPGAVARTSTEALTNATLPYIITLAEKGVKRALKEDANLLNGLNTCLGEVTCEPVSMDLGLTLASFDRALSRL